MTLRNSSLVYWVTYAVAHTLHPVNECMYTKGEAKGRVAWRLTILQRSAPVAAMVRLSGLAERSFKRRFKSATGMAPLEYVHTLRLEEAKQMLESSDLPIEAIASEVGYEDAGFFQSVVPAPGESDAGSIPQAVRRTATHVA